MEKDLESAAPFQENGEENSTAGGTETATWITVLGEGGHLCHLVTFVTWPH